MTISPRPQQHLIEHVIEPKSLWLAWQSSDSKSRRRCAVAKITRQGDDAVLTYQKSDDLSYAVERGFEGFPGFELKKQSEYTQNVMDVLIRRLPPRSRSDFDQYLARLRLPSGVKISDFALLGYSEAKLPSDGFSIVNDYRSTIGHFEFLSEVAGIRHYANAKDFIQKVFTRQLALEFEPDNPHDENAIAILQGDKKIGYVNRIQAPSFVTWKKFGTVEVTLDRVTIFPQEDLRANMFVRVKYQPKR